MTQTAVLNIAGLILNLFGVILLFLFGMPFRVRTEGKFPRTYVRADSDEAVRLERLYSLLSWLGLILIVGGTVLQICAIALS
jgi:hypothetical protein